MEELENPLTEAIERGDLELLSWLVRTDAVALLEQLDQDHLTALGCAVRDQTDSGFARVLLDSGADVNGPAPEGCSQTPLQLALEHGKVEIARLLLQRGADLDRTGCAGCQPSPRELLRERPTFREILAEELAW